MPIQYIVRRSSAFPTTAKANAAPIYVDSDDNKLKFNGAGSGTTELEISAQAAFASYAADGAIPVVSGVAYLTKGSAGAYTLAAPGASGIGTRITLTTGTDFAHVVTFTGTTLQDGTAGANSTWTSAAVQGSSLTVLGVTATKWNVESFNLGTIAP